MPGAGFVRVKTAGNQLLHASFSGVNERLTASCESALRRERVLESLHVMIGFVADRSQIKKSASP